MDPYLVRVATALACTAVVVIALLTTAGGASFGTAVGVALTTAVLVWFFVWRARRDGRR